MKEAIPLKRFFSRRSLRFQILTIVILVLVAPVTIMAYDFFFAEKGERILRDDREARLVAVVNFLHSQITNELAANPSGIGTELETAVHTAFHHCAEDLALKHPGTRLGLYVVGSNNISVQGFLHEYRDFTPSQEKQREERVRREASDGIQEVLRAGCVVSHVGSTWDDQFLERLVPITNGGQTIGVVWAEERMHPLFAHSQSFRFVTRTGVMVTLVISALAAILIIINLNNRLTQIKKGVIQLEKDLNSPLPDLPGEFGEITRVVNTMAKGLAEKELLLEDLRRSDCLAALGRLVTGIAHELRNPLGILKATVQVMEEDYPDNQGIQDFARRLNQQIDRQHAIVNELLDFGRPSRGIIAPQSINTLITKVLRFTEPLLRQHKITVNLELDPDQPCINGDAEKLKQVFVNIVLNAVQAMPDNGLLNITTSHDLEWVKTSFEDTGPGLPADVLPHIFEPFYTTKELDGGSGLGLAVSHQIIGMHGGRIKAENKEGKGMRMTIYLPTKGGATTDAA